jgi:surface-adhesin protein E
MSMQAATSAHELTELVMDKRLAGLCLLTVCLAVLGAQAGAQTPEQQKLWDAQEAQARAAEKARAEKLGQEREARRADPMAWAHTLDPLLSGGWEFRTVAGDGSWAVFVSEHQLKRSGQVMSVWLRQEYAEPQKSADNETYLSEVQRVDFDCGKDRARATAIIYYAGNNLRGTEQAAAIEPKESPWSPIVPGTQSESNFQWACTPERMKSAK